MSSYFEHVYPLKKAANHIPVYDFAPENDLGTISLRCVPLEVRNSYDFSEPHRHAYFEVFFFRRGGGTHLIDFVAHRIIDNSVHIVRPGQVHLLLREPDSHGAVLHFSNELLVHLGKATRSLLQARFSVLSFKTISFEAIDTLLAMLQQELATPFLSLEIPVAYLDLLLMKMARDATGSGPLPEEEALFSAFRNLAEKHYREGKQPCWYAAQLFITEKRLNETCKATTGNTVSHYLKERVLLEAKRLLSYSEGSIKEIGYYLGFEDPAYFTRFFRKNAGLTAGAFRNQYQ